MVGALAENDHYKILYKPDADGELLAVRLEQLLLNGRYHGIFNGHENLTRLLRRYIRRVESERKENGSDEEQCDWTFARRKRLSLIHI